MAGRHYDTTAWPVQELWADQNQNLDQVLAALQTGRIVVASAAAVGGLAYGVLGSERGKLRRERGNPLDLALAGPLGPAEQTGARGSPGAAGLSADGAGDRGSLAWTRRV